MTATAGSHFTAHDARMMARAIKLAEKGRFTTSPNPNVGCVLTDDKGTIVGEGWHQKAGTPHAEIHALTMAQEKAKGATAYVTLEPCSHFGRTPPCAQSLIDAGVAKVIAAGIDPHDKVAGKGLAQLANAGIQVEQGLLQQQAEILNRGFLKRMRTGMPFVTVKLAASVDGKTALANGKSQWITGKEARRDVQIGRAESCAVLSGSGTVIADNPSLNVRLDELHLNQLNIAESELRQPLRVIVDGSNKLTPDYKLFGIEGDILLANKESNKATFNDPVTQWQCPTDGRYVDLSLLMGYLGTLQLNHVWVEAGAILAGALFAANLVDELILYQSPQLLGHKGRNLVNLPELTEMDQAIQLQPESVTQMGDDLKRVFTVGDNRH